MGLPRYSPSDPPSASGGASAVNCTTEFEVIGTARGTWRPDHPEIQVQSTALAGPPDAEGRREASYRRKLPSSKISDQGDVAGDSAVLPTRARSRSS
jgi:hypothetical protein